MRMQGLVQWVQCLGLGAHVVRALGQQHSCPKGERQSGPDEEGDKASWVCTWKHRFAVRVHIFIYIYIYSIYTWFCECVCVCACVYIYTHTYIHTYIHTYTHIYIYECVCVYYIYIYMYIALVSQKMGPSQQFDRHRFRFQCLQGFPVKADFRIGLGHKHLRIKFEAGTHKFHLQSEPNPFRGCGGHTTIRQ